MGLLQNFHFATAPYTAFWNNRKQFVRCCLRKAGLDTDEAEEQKDLPPRQIPLLFLIISFIFAAFRVSFRRF